VGIRVPSIELLWQIPEVGPCDGEQDDHGTGVLNVGKDVFREEFMLLVVQAVGHVEADVLQMGQLSLRVEIFAKMNIWLDPSKHLEQFHLVSQHRQRFISVRSNYLIQLSITY
jgi:hypothetical protein